jgi:tetratricopeptide (TPR) repeat protein
MRRIAILSIGLLAALTAFGQTAPPAPAAGAMGAAGASGPKIPKPKSAAENNAVLAMFKAADPDAQIKAAGDFLTTYPDSDYKAQALVMQAQAYHDKRDDPKAISFGEQALDADPANYSAHLLLAEVYSRTSKNTDLDLNDKLAKIDKYSKDALAELAAAPKPKPDMSDADWATAKKPEEERAWVALGFAGVLSKKFDDATTNFQKAMDLYPDPLDMLYIERGYIDAKRFDDAVTWCDKVNASPNANDQLKGIATKDKARAQALKKQAASQ